MDRCLKIDHASCPARGTELVPRRRPASDPRPFTDRMGSEVEVRDQSAAAGTDQFLGDLGTRARTAVLA
jgi:hypothetical protein